MNNLIPLPSKIQKITQYTPQIKLLRSKSETNFPHFNPGQIIMVSILGIGEAAFGIVSSPFETKTIDFLFRKVGTLTSALDRKKINDTIFIRGPYGNGFPVKESFGKDLILVAGGTGIAPIASLVEYIIKKRKEFGKVYLLYGAKTPHDILLREKYTHWQKFIYICLTVEEGTPGWHEHIGLVTNLCEIPQINKSNTHIIMVGPPIMYQSTIDRFRKLGITKENIYVGLERKMRCATGTCQHCNCGKYLLCTSGHVYRFDQIEGEKI